VGPRAALDYIYVVNGSGTVTRLTNNGGSQPAWSPGGSKIAFVRSDGTYVMNANGTGVTRLTSSGATDKAPAWSPNATQIAFVSNRADQHDEIYVMNANGTGVTRLTKNLPIQGCGGPIFRRFEESPTWSPDGGKIAFLHKSTCFSYDIEVMNANGTAVTRLVNGGFAGKLAWGPTGKIAFDPRVQPGVGLSDHEIRS
jgi:TolB protein